MTYFIQIFGCQMNRSDAERIASLFESLGISPVSVPEKADIFVAVMCSVRQMAADRVFGLEQKFKQIKKTNPGFKSILTGCIVESDKERFAKIFNHIFDIRSLNKWPVRMGLKKNGGDGSDYFRILPKHSSKFSALISISKGCDNYCTYCVVPYTRGPLESRPAKSILRETESAVKNGAKEIWLLGQNVNNYHSGNVNFAKLLRAINKIEGDFWIRFTSPHPKDFSDEAVLAMAQCLKVTPYLNLPVQSGDNMILKAMNRPYDISSYETLVKKIRGAFKKYRKGLEKNVAMSTDVIVGFPGENKIQFNNTARMFKKIKYDMAYIAQYSPRSGTAAAKLDDNVSKIEKKRREEIINDIVKKTAFGHNKKFAGKTVEVLVDSTKNNYFGLGKTRHYKTVKFGIEKTHPASLIGKIVNVKITNAQSFGLIGKLLD